MSEEYFFQCDCGKVCYDDEREKNCPVCGRPMRATWVPDQKQAMTDEILSDLCEV